MKEIVQTHRQNIKQLQIATRICWLTLRIYLLENVKNIYTVGSAKFINQHFLKLTFTK